jgi:hypothetical protein
MGVILTGIVAAAVIAIGAGFYMRSEQEPAWEVFSTSSTRVGDPGENLVGPGWTGDPDAEAAQAEESDSPA